MRLSICLLLALSSNASAGERARSKRAFEEAERRYNLGEFEAALALFREAYDAAPLPDLLFNIAQCHRNLGHTTEAIFFFERFLEQRPNTGDADQIRALVKELRARPPPEATATMSAPAPPPVLLKIEPKPIEPSSSLVNEWWFWTVIAAGAVIVAGGTVLAVRASGDGDLPAHPIATFDYR